MDHIGSFCDLKRKSSCFYRDKISKRQNRKKLVQKQFMNFTVNPNLVL